jgi:hypothetical protein
MDIQLPLSWATLFQSTSIYHISVWAIWIILLLIIVGLPSFLFHLAFATRNFACISLFLIRATFTKLQFLGFDHHHKLLSSTNQETPGLPFFKFYFPPPWATKPPSAVDLIPVFKLHKILPTLPLQSFPIHCLNAMETFRFTFNWWNKLVDLF